MVQASITDYERLRRELGAYGVVRHVLDTHYALSWSAIRDHQADAPDEYKTYLHRSGRTGRAGKSGRVVTLITRQRQRKMTEMLERAEIAAPYVNVRPGDDMINAVRRGQ